MADGEDAGATVQNAEGSSVDTALEEAETQLQALKAAGPDLNEFTEEFENMLRLLKKANENTTRLNNKKQALTAAIAAKREKAVASAKGMEDIKTRQERYRADIARFNAESEKIKQKERETAAEIADVEAEVQKLQAKLDIGPGLTADQEKMIKSLQERKETLTREGDARTNQLTNLRVGTKQLSDTLMGVEQARVASQLKISQIREAIAQTRADTEQAQRRKDKLDRELRDLSKEVEKYEEEIEERDAKIKEGAAQLEVKEAELKRRRASISIYVKANDDLHLKMIGLQKEHDERLHSNELIENGNKTQDKELRSRAEEIDQLDLEVRRLQKLKEHSEKKTTKVMAQQAKSEMKRIELNRNISETLAMIEAENKELQAQIKQKKVYERQRDILNKNLVKEGDTAQATFDLMKIQENTIKNLNNELTGYREYALKQRGVIKAMEEDRDRYDQEAQEAQQQYYAALENVKLAELQIAEVQKQIVDQETKLKSQQNTYESVRSDRNLKSKNLLESQDKVVLMKQKFKILSHSIEQLKQEIVSKDQRLVKEHFSHHRVENEIQTLRNDLTRIKKQIQSSEQIINNQVSEIRKLSKIIADADAERLRQRKEFDAVIAERDMLGTQLIRRNNEVKALYEKIKIVRSTLSKGEWTYDERLDDYDYLREEIEEARKELQENKEAVAPLDKLRQMIISLEKELLQEKNKVTALSEELERPMYVHRWRRLAGSDPKRFAMIQKIQTLQKRLVAKTEEVVAKDAVILEKEKLYVELKNVLARQPGPEVAEQLTLYQKNLKEKKEQMKKVNVELALYKEQVQKHKETIENIYQQMEKLKKTYFKKMKKEFFAQLKSATPASGH